MGSAMRHLTRGKHFRGFGERDPQHLDAHAWAKSLQQNLLPIHKADGIAVLIPRSCQLRKRHLFPSAHARGTLDVFRDSIEP